MANRLSIEIDRRGHIDPFELLIDAGICDRMCEPLGWHTPDAPEIAGIQGRQNRC